MGYIKFDRSLYNDEIFHHRACLCDLCDDRNYQDADEAYEMARDEELMQ